MCKLNSAGCLLWGLCGMQSNVRDAVYCAVCSLVDGMQSNVRDAVLSMGCSLMFGMQSNERDALWSTGCSWVRLRKRHDV